MFATQLLRAFIFLALAGSVYLLAAAFAVQQWKERTGRWAPPSPRVKWLRRAVFGLAVLGVLCIGYGYFVEPYWLEVTHVRIETGKLASARRPIRIVLVSDLHSDPKPRLEDRLPEVVAGLKPDVILFPGDAINSPQGLPVFRECLRRLAALAPTFVVRGNWDAAMWNGLDLFGGTGARELDGNAVRVAVAGSEIWVVGAAFGNESRIGTALAQAPEQAFRVLLYHTPDEIYQVADLGADLYCAGHTHGGQVALPGYGALVTLSRYDKRFEAGLYRVKQTWLYVSRGIGMEGGPLPRVRFDARPEVTVIELAGKR